VDMVGSDRQGVESPNGGSTHMAKGLIEARAGMVVKENRVGRHHVAGNGTSIRVGRMDGLRMLSVDGTTIVAMEPRAVGGPSEEICKRFGHGGIIEGTWCECKGARTMDVVGRLTPQQEGGLCWGWGMGATMWAGD